MNKVMKILMIVVALIIAFILIFAVGKAAGILNLLDPEQQQKIHQTKIQ
mgnify:CR=1 FL=1